MQTHQPSQNERPSPSRRLMGVLIGLCFTAAIPFSATAQTFPEKPITIVVTFAAGSGSDVAARFYAQALKETLDATAVVDIKPGGLGMIGAHAVARSEPDGYTVLMGSGTVNAANYALYRDRIMYKPQQFETVAILAVSSTVLFATKDLIGDTIQDVIEDAKRKQRKLACGSGNAITQVACVMLGLKTGIDIVNVPYKGNAQSIADVASGQIPLAVSDTGAALPLIQAGMVRPVAIPSRNRLSEFPDVKTFDEQGIPDFDFLSWNGIFVPAGTPKGIIAKLNEVARHMLASPEWDKQRITINGVKIGGDLQESQEFVTAEINKWERYVQKSGVKLEQ